MPLIPILIILGIGAFLIFGTKLSGGKVSTGPAAPGMTPVLGGSAAPQHYQDGINPGQTETNNNIRVGDLLIVAISGIMSNQKPTGVETHGTSLIPVGSIAGPTVTWHAVAPGTTTLVAHFTNGADGSIVVNVRP